MDKLLNLYLLINYGAGVQLSNIENERTLMLSDTLIGFQCMHLFATFSIYAFYPSLRSVPFGYQLLSIAAVCVFLYKVVRPASHQRFHTAGLARIYRELPRGWRAAYAVAGCTLTLVGFWFIYAMLLYRQHHP